MRSRTGASSRIPEKSGLCSVRHGCCIERNRPRTPANLEYIWALLRNMQKQQGLAGSAAGAESLLRVQHDSARPATSERGAADFIHVTCI